MKILLIPRNLARLAFQFFAPKHLVRAETFSPSLPAPTTPALFPRHDDHILLALHLLRHEAPRAQRKALEAEARSIDVARGAAARTGAVRARHRRLEAAQQARRAHAHLLVGRRVGQRSGKE